MQYKRFEDLPVWKAAIEFAVRVYALTAMDEFVDFDWNLVLALIAALLLMAIWSCAVLAIDHWVGSGRTPQ